MAKPKPQAQPKSDKPKPIRASFFIPSADYLAAKKMAEVEDMSISAFISRCVRRALGK